MKKGAGTAERNRSEKIEDATSYNILEAKRTEPAYRLPFLEGLKGGVCEKKFSFNTFFSCLFGKTKVSRMGY
ncbi:MAG: hypothetical protein ABIK80_04395 [candidate division WOR-3 bacterium]